MNSDNLNKYLIETGRFGTWGYIFFSIVPYAVAGKHVCSGLMLLAFCGLLLRKQFKNFSANWLTVSILLIIFFAFVSAVLSPYAVDSLNQLRKDGLPFLVGFLLLSHTPSSDCNRIVVYTLLSLMLGYFVKEFLALWAGVSHDFKFSIYEKLDIAFPKYLEFFSSDTPYYLPFLLGPLFFWPMKPWQRTALFTLVALAVVMVVLSGVRTSFIFVALSLMLVLLYRFWNFKRLLILIVGVLVLAGYLLKEQITNPSIARYATIVSPHTYQFGKDYSVSERYAIVKGVWEISKDRLLLGYGLGWKKLPKIAEVNGYMDRWRNSVDPLDQATFNYFSLGEGRVNPHNFYMLLLFEGGLLGAIAYISLMFSISVGVCKILLSKPDSIKKGVAVGVAIYMIVFFCNSLSGGTWLAATMLVTAVCLSHYQRKAYANS